MPGVVTNAFLMGVGTALSRVTGFVRDAVFAFFFGTNPQADTFILAYNLMFFVESIFLAGAMSSVAMPLLGEAERSGKSAHHYARLLALFVLVWGTVLSFVLLLFAGPAIRVFAPGFSAEELEAAKRILKGLAFAVPVIAISYYVMDLLRLFKNNFFVPGIAPVAFNAAYALTVCTLCRFLGIRSAVLAVWLGAFAQLFVQIPFLTGRWEIGRKSGMGKGPSAGEGGVHSRGEALKFWVDFLARFTMSAVTLSIGRLNALVDRAFASMIGTGAVSSLYYAQRVYLLPIGLIGVGLGTAVMRELSLSDESASGRVLKPTYDALNFSIPPFAVGFIVFGKEIIATLYQRGSFSEASTATVSLALAGYSIGMWAQSANNVFTRIFQSAGDYKTPLRVSGSALVLNVILDLLLYRPLKVLGLALASSFSVAFAALLNALVLPKGKRAPFPLRQFLLAIWLASISKAVASGFWGIIIFGVLYTVCSAILPGPKPPLPFGGVGRKWNTLAR